MPPVATDGSSYDERDYANDTKNRCSRLPTTCSLLLLSGEMLLSIQSLLFLGELLLGNNSSLSFFSSVSEQGMSLWGVHGEHEHHEDDENNGFHGWKRKETGSIPASGDDHR